MRQIIFPLILFCFCNCKSEYIVHNTTTYGEQDTCLHYATFRNNDSAFLDFFHNNAKPVLAKYKIHEEILVFYLVFSISENGEIDDVEFIRFDLNDQCKKELLYVFQNMGNWIPACKNNRPVKSKRLFKIEY